MNKIFRSIAVTLLALFLVNTLPAQAVGKLFNINNPKAETSDTVATGTPVATDTPQTTDITEAQKKEPEIVGELTDKREENIKHFFKSDNSCEAVVYPIPVHYKDNGKWNDIDNTLQEGTDTSFTTDTVTQKVNDNVFKNKKNNFDVSFAKNSKSNKLVDLKKDNYEISWGIDNSKQSSAKVNPVDTKKLEEKIQDEVDKKVENDKKYKSLSKDERQQVKDIIKNNEKKKTVEKAVSSITYSDIYKDVDLTYDVIGDLVKENFIVNKPQKNLEIKVNLDTKNLVPKLQKDKSIVFYDANDSSKAIFRMNEPVMYDSNKADSNKIELSIENTKKGYTICMKPDSEWLNSSDRKYPVTIDPPVQTSLGVNDIHDTFVCSIDTDNKWVNQYVRVGNLNSTGVGIVRGYIKFTLPQLTSSDMIIGAQLDLAEAMANDNGAQINVHKVLGDWDSYSIRWNNMPSYNPVIEDYNMVNTNNQEWKVFNITSIVKDWYNTGNNYGLMLKANNEASGNVAFWSSDISDDYSWARPRVNINYVSNVGLEGYWTTHSQDVGRAGTGYVNDYTGNLTFIHNDLSMTGNIAPISVYHVYNANDAVNNIDIGYGVGWRLNLSQTITSQNLFDGQENKLYYIYTDEDGTKHYFKWDAANYIKDNEGLGLVLTKYPEGTFTVTDKKNNELAFYSDGYLSTIKDANGNTIKLEYAIVAGKKVLTLVKDGVDRINSIRVDGNGTLQCIVDSSGNEINYGYNGNKLSSVTYKDGNVSSYEYDGNKLRNATNYDGYRVSYGYSGVSPYRVTNIDEANTNGTKGGNIGISYGDNTTTFLDNYTYNQEIYNFNNCGNTISVKDRQGNAKYYKYDDITNTNKLTTESKMQKSVMNLVRNGNVETDSDYAFYNGPNGNIGFSSDAYYFGSRSIKISRSDNTSINYADEVVSLEKGKTYTASVYIKTNNVTNSNNAGACITAYSKDKDGNYFPKSSKQVQGTNDWTRIETTFTVPSDSTDNNVIIRVSLGSESGTVYFDALQVEEGAVSNRYNLIQNGEMDGSGIPGCWQSNGCDSRGSVITISDATHPNTLNNNVFKLDGDATKSIQKIYQHINVSGKKGDVYSVGAWGKANAVSRGKFALEVIVNSASPQIATTKFNTDSSAWQYVNDRVVAQADYSSLDVYLIYENNVNTAYFDGVQLYKEEYGASYQYDSKGNVISTQDLASQNSKFEYNGNNDLMKTTDPKGNSFKYEYDNKHNVTRATSATDKNYSFEYDDHGNPVSSRIGEGADYIQSKAQYSSNGNYLKSLTDSLGNTVNYNYNDVTGLLNSVTDAKNSVTNYSYDNMNRLQSVSKSVDGKTITNSYAYKNDRIDSITHNGFSYNFGYNSLGNNTTVSVGNQNLITNTFEDKTQKLIKSTYGNGQTVRSSYDGSGRVVSKFYDADSSVGVSYSAQVQNIGWQANVNDGTMAGTTGQALRLEGLKIQLINPIAGMKIKYQAHVQNVGWQPWVYDGNLAGTEGQSLSMEAIKIQLEGAPKGYSVRYQVHVQGLGWMDPVKDGEMAGTIGQSRRIEAIKIYVEKARFTYDYDANGNVAFHNDFVNDTQYRYIYDISNRLTKVTDSKGNELSYEFDSNNNMSSVNDKVNNSTHKTSYAYDSDNKETAIAFGTGQIINSYDTLGRLKTNTINTGQTKYNVNYNYQPGARTSTIGVKYNGYLADGKWQGDKTDGEISGTVGQSLQYKQIQIDLTNVPTDTANELSKMKIKYQTHVGYIGWQDWVYGGTVAGQAGNPYYIQAIRIQLEGAPAGYHVWYQVQVQDKGWTEPVKDGAMAGTEGQSLRLEAIRIFITKPGVDSKDSTTISSIDNNGSQIAYTYDANGNINTITQNGKIITYTYNEANELTREDNQVLNKTIKYTYDAGGNIQNKSEYAYTTGTPGTATKVYNYAYGDSNWKDKLTSFDGMAITYDNIGNPLTYNGFTYTWEMGRQLAKINRTGLSASYKYNDSGVRTQKTVNGVTTNFHLVGDKVTYEENGTDSIYYNYDSAGDLVSMSLNDDHSHDLYDSTGANTAVQISGSGSAAEKFTASETFDKVSVICPSWGNDIGNLTLSLYRWNTDYNTSIAASPIATKQFVNFIDNQWLQINFTAQAAGDYIWVLSSPTENVGVWKDANSNNSSTAYLNGSEVTGDYFSKIGYKSSVYYYIRNAQNDIIGLIDENGVTVASYTYDSWGKLISIKDQNGTDVTYNTAHIGYKNPYRYRGYRYDNETGMYYLQSRYYIPGWGRFINADEIAAITGELLSENMFAYCKNNVVNMHDPDGFTSVRNYFDYDKWYDKNVEEKGRSSDAKKRERNQINSAFGKDRAKREKESADLHKGKKGQRNDDNRSYDELKNGDYYKININEQAGLILLGTTIIIGTIVEDVATGGIGILDDPVSISAGCGIIIKAFP